MKGEVIIYRTYRDDVTKAVTDAFRTQVIARKEHSTKPPILLIDKVRSGGRAHNAAGVEGAAERDV